MAVRDFCYLKLLLSSVYKLLGSGVNAMRLGFLSASLGLGVLTKGTEFAVELSIVSADAGYGGCDY